MRALLLIGGCFCVGYGYAGWAIALFVAAWLVS